MDTYAWIEYLDGSPKGAEVRDIIESPANAIITSPITIAEIASKYIRARRNPDRALIELQNNSSIPPVDSKLARTAGDIHAEQRKTQKDFPLADAFVAATARIQRCKILTGDPHFKGFNEATMI